MILKRMQITNPLILLLRVGHLKLRFALAYTPPTLLFVFSFFYTLLY